MRYLSFIFSLLVIGILTACIQDEPLNAEADILTCVVDQSILKKDPIIHNERIQIFVKSDTDLSSQSPIFTLTPGATISPASGTTRNFTDPQIYTVTSEDRKSVKNYEVDYVISALGSIFSFENMRLQNNRYPVFYEVDENGKTTMDWASGNAGFSLTGVASGPDDYPTTGLAEGKVGKGVQLITRSTGNLGESLGKPMAAGNLFMGEFDLLSSISNPLKSLKLGMPVEYIPSAINGFYKYKAGPVFKDNGQEVPGKKDSWDVYAIFFETDNDLKYLDGTNQFSHPNIVSIARIPEKYRLEAANWRYFHIPFKALENKTVDRKKLADGKYSLTIVFTSSIEGDFFNGAEGSTLLIDEIELIQSDND